MASADYAKSALRDVRGGVLRDAVHHGAGAGVFTDRAGEIQSAKATQDREEDFDPAGDLRRDSFDPASVVAGHAISHHAGKAASFLVQPAAAAVLFPVRDCSGTGNDHLRVVVEFEAFRIATGIASATGTRTGAGRSAWRLWHFAPGRSGESRRAQASVSSRIRDLFVLA